MPHPIPQPVADGRGDEPPRGPHPNDDPGDRLQAYAALLDECYLLLSRRAELETDASVADPTTLDQYAEIQARLRTVRREIDDLADEFDQHDFRRAIRYLLRR